MTDDPILLDTYLKRKKLVIDNWVLMIIYKR